MEVYTNLRGERHISTSILFSKITVSSDSIVISSNDDLKKSHALTNLSDACQLTNLLSLLSA